jgi:hypothetical protein
MTWKFPIAAAAMAVMMAPSLAQADSSIGAVEGARAKERQGAYLTRQDRDNLRRYGSNDDYGYGGYYGGYGSYGYGPPVYRGAYYDDGYGYGYGPSVGIYIGD